MLRPAHLIQLSVVAALGMGLVMIQSAGMRVEAADDPDTVGSFVRILLGRNTVYALIAIAAMMAAAWFDVGQLFRARGLANPLWWVLGLALALTALTLVPGFGREVNGATRWLQVGPISFQPSELVKWLLLLAVAWWCARRRGVMHRFWHGLLPPVLLVALACVLVVLEDLGTAILIGTVALCLMYAGGARWWHLGLLTIPGLVAVVGLIASSPFRLRRLLAFLNPWADPEGAGYHPIQSMLAIAQGGPIGRGLGNGLQKFGYLPEDTTDFIFAVICEELGLAGAVLVAALYLTVLWIGVGILRDCRDTFGRLVALGILLTFGLQAVINLAVVTVVIPTKGIALPLISSGGTGWIMTAIALGLLAALDNAHFLKSQVPVAELISKQYAEQRRVSVFGFGVNPPGSSGFGSSVLAHTVYSLLTRGNLSWCHCRDRRAKTPDPTIRLRRSAESKRQTANPAPPMPQPPPSSSWAVGPGVTSTPTWPWRNACASLRRIASCTFSFPTAPWTSRFCGASVCRSPWRPHGPSPGRDGWSIFGLRCTLSLATGARGPACGPCSSVGT